MLLPYIQFEETVEGTAPIRTNIRNRIGIVGEFSKGPANVATNIAGYSDFANRFGIDTKNGSLAFQTAWDQGAQDFIVVRVLGREILANQRVIVANNSTIPEPAAADVTTYYVGDPVQTTASHLVLSGVESGGIYTGPTGRYHFRLMGYFEESMTFQLASLPTGGSLQVGSGDPLTWSSLSVGGNFSLAQIIAGQVRFQATSGNIAATTFTVTVPAGLGPNRVATISIPAVAATTMVFSNSPTLTVGGSTITNPIRKVTILADNFQIAYQFVASEIEPAPASSVEEAATLTTASWNEAASLDITPDSTRGYFLALDDSTSVITPTHLNGISLTFQDVDALRVGDQWAIRVIRDFRTIEFNEGEGSNAIINRLITELSNTGIYGTLETVFESGTRYLVFTLNPRLIGSAEVSSKFRLDIDLYNTQGTVNPINGVFTLSNLGRYTGAVSGPRFAYRDYFSDDEDTVPLIRIQSLYQGTKGNSISVTVTPKGPGVFDVEVVDNNVELLNPGLTRELYADVRLVDSDVDGSLRALSNSRLIRGFFLPKLYFRLSNVNDYVLLTPDLISTTFEGSSVEFDLLDLVIEGSAVPYNLIGGSEGPEVTDADYIKALELLESQPVHIVIASGKTSRSIRSSLIRHVEQADELEGLRVAVLPASRGLVPDYAKQDSSGLESRRAVMVAGWTNYFRYPDLPAFSVAPDGYYAGKLAATRYYVGPHARRTAGFITGVTGVDTSSYSSRSSLQVYTDAKMEILAVDPATQAYVFSNGRTLSSDPLWDQIYIRRTYDVIRQDLYDLIQFYRSEPNTPLLARQVLTAINAYMGDKQRNGEIYSFRPATISTGDDPITNLVSRRLGVVVPFLPNYAADYITITLFRDSQTGNVSAGI